jgi:HK97 family phage portal protein
MGLLQSLFNGNVKTSGMQMAKFLDGYAPIFTQFGRSIYASDVVQMCIDCIATECSKLTPQHVVVDDDGLPMPAKGDNFNRLFKFSPNGMMTTRDFLEKVVWQLFLNYNAFIYPVYSLVTDGRGGISRKYTSFYPLNPIQVEFLQDTTDVLFVKFYFFNGSNYTLPYNDVIHLRKKYSINDVMGGGISGHPDNQALLNVLNTNDVVVQGIGKAIKTTLGIRGIMKINTMMDDDKQKAERIRFEQSITDGETGILPMDMKGEYVPLTIDPKLIDKDTMEFLENKVLRWFGVSLPILNGVYTDEQYQAFYNKTIQPIAIGMGQAFSGAIFSQREQDIGHEIKFYHQNLELMDVKNKMAFVTALGDRGALTDNQILALFGMQPYEGGNVRKVSLNYINSNISDIYQLGRAGMGKGGPQPTDEKV